MHPGVAELPPGALGTLGSFPECGYWCDYCQSCRKMRERLMGSSHGSWATRRSCRKLWLTWNWKRACKSTILLNRRRLIANSSHRKETNMEKNLSLLQYPERGKKTHWSFTEKNAEDVEYRHSMSSRNIRSMRKTLQSESLSEERNGCQYFYPSSTGLGIGVRSGGPAVCLLGL
ncbi:uncharacterized protein RHO17_006532 isoform 1-T2 [Thomomys bottae]